MAKALTSDGQTLKSATGVAGQTFLQRITPQPLIGVLVASAALTVIALSWATHRPSGLSPSESIIFAVLTMAIVASRLWPLHVGKVTRLYVASVPLYLLSCLFPPVIAAIGIGAGMLAGEALICRRCQNTAGDVATQVGRWMLVGFGVSAIVHVSVLASNVFVGIIAALLLWGGDILTCPLVFSPVTGQDPLTTAIRVARRSWPGEPMQYLIGMLALLLFQSDITSMGLAWTDLFAAGVVILPIVLLYVYLRGEDDLKRATASWRSDTAGR